MLEIAPGGADDIPAVERLRDGLHWSRAGRLLRAMFASHGVLLLAHDAGELVACGSAVRYGDSGFIGNMIVAQPLRGRGIGGRIFRGLLDWLAAEGATSVQLDATDEGKPLYQRHGFVARWTALDGRLARPPLPSPPDPAIAPPSEEGWHEIAAIDARAFGAPRGPFLRALAGEGDCRVLALRAGGRIMGYGMRMEQRLGPLVAVSDHVAERLAAALLLGAPERTVVTFGSRTAAPLWRKLGFELAPGDLRMVRGEPPDDRPANIFAAASGVTG